MRILYATPAYKPAYRMGGPIASISAAAERLVHRGHQVTVVTTNANLDEDLDVPIGHAVDIEGVEVLYFKRDEPLRKWVPFIPYLSQSMGFTYSRGMREALDRIVPDVDIVHTQMPFVYTTYAAARSALRHGKPLFYHQRGNFLDTRLQRRRLKKSLYIALFEKPVLRRASMLVALTGSERAAFEALSPDTPCEIVPNGVFLPLPTKGAAERVERRWGIPADAQVVLYLGRLETWKGAPETVEAFARIANVYPKSWLIMAGVDVIGMSKQPRERVLFTGSVAGGEKEDLLDRADLFCLPSAGEGLSMATLEAFAQRTAALLSPGCNLPEAEAAGAAVIAEKSAAAVAEAMSRLLGDPDRLRAMGQAGRRFVEANYSWDVVIDRLTELYASAAAGRR